MLNYGSPKALWDHCIEIEALSRSHAALDIYGLEGQVPETVMSGQTGYISSLCEFEWFEWECLACQSLEHLQLVPP